MRDIYNMIIRRALSEVKKKIRPRPPGGSRFGFKPGPGSRAGGKGFVPVHERRTAGRFAEADGLPEHPPDKGHSHWRWRRYWPWPLRSLRRSVHAYRAPMTYHTAIQMRQRMRVSSSFFERKKSGECSVHSQFSSAFRDCGASRRGRTPQLNCIKPSQEYSKKRDGRMCFLLTQDAIFISKSSLHIAYMDGRRCVAQRSNCADRTAPFRRKQRQFRRKTGWVL